MHASTNRRTATKVKNGRVQRKNRHAPTAAQRLIIDRESPGRGFRHVVTKRDVLAFIELIPDWPRLSERLEQIKLSSGGEDWYGRCEFFDREETGAIFLAAWDEDLWMDVNPVFFADHEELLNTLGVAADPQKKCEDGRVVVPCRFTEPQARAFVLLHVFLHELGHHYHNARQKHRNPGSGEDYAERFANSRFKELYPSYVRCFGDPAISDR